jgi:hypothetical protein
MVNVELPGEPRRGVAILDPKFAARAVAVGVHRCLGHTQLSRDLFRRKMLVDQSQAFTFARRQQRNRFLGDDVACDHSDSS